MVIDKIGDIESLSQMEVEIQRSIIFQLLEQFHKLDWEKIDPVTDSEFMSLTPYILHRITDSDSNELLVAVKAGTEKGEVLGKAISLKNITVRKLGGSSSL